MNLLILILAGSLAVSVLVALVLSARSLVARFVASILALGCAAFCVFGFLASFEPSDVPNWPWQVAYGIVGVSSLVSVFFLLKGGRQRCELAESAN